VILPLHTARCVLTCTLGLDAMTRGSRTNRKPSRSRSKTRSRSSPHLILIVRCKEIGCGVPVLMLNRVEKIPGVMPHLPFGLPEPDEIKACAKSDGQPTTKTSAKRNRHSTTLFFPTKAGHLSDGISRYFFEEGSTGSFTDWSRSQPSFSSLICSMVIALALASRLGRISYSETQQR
jgi:hypothetical protein